MKTETGTTSTRIRRRAVFTGMIMATALLAAGPGVLAQENGAKSILKAMADYVNSQSTIEFTFDSDIEVITPELEKIQFTNSGGALLSRPDKLHAHRVGGFPTWSSSSTVRPSACSAKAVTAMPNSMVRPPWIS